MVKLPKYPTDYGVLMELFINVMLKQDPELHHKSFVKKITNKLTRMHKRRVKMCIVSEKRARRAIDLVEKETSHVEISIGALCWLIYNKHKEEMKLYSFYKEPFEDLNQFYNAQGVTMQTAKILTMIEGAMYE